MSLHQISLFVVALMGLAFGSFANVVIHRLKASVSLRERSTCPHCHARISMGDLIPGISWIRLGGRCRACQERISVRYPAVELIVAALFVIAYLRHPFIFLDTNTASFVFEAGVAWALVVIAAFDLQWQLIPMKVVWSTIVAVVGWQLIVLSVPWLPLLLGAAFAGGWMLLLFLLSRGKWIGSGDIWLAILLGLGLGWPRVALSLYLTYVIAGLVAAVLLISGYKRFGQRLAFAPFLVIGFFGAWWVGVSMLAWVERAFLY